MCGFAGTGPALWVCFIIFEGGAIQNEGNYINFEGMVLFRRNDCLYAVSARLYVLVCASTHHHAFTVHVHACASFACVLHMHALAV